MKNFSILRPVSICLLTLLLLPGSAFPQSSDEPDKKPPSASTKIKPEAKALLQKVQQAYNDIEEVELTGQVSVNIDSSNIKEKTNQHFTSSFEAPNKFRHTAKDSLTVGSN